MTLIEMEKFLVDAARRSIKALDLSLGSETPLNTPDEGQSAP
ncbi:hypothetical protein [Pararhizobium gei]|nr:hypothetical protein [Rhizobium gei]